MLQSCLQSHDWFCESEPLLFDEEFCQSLMKDLQSIPTPPQSPPMKAGLGKSLSNVDQLELVSELLLEDSDFPLNWNNDFFDANVCDADSNSQKDRRTEVSDDCLWHCLTDKPGEEKLPSVLSTSPLLSEIDPDFFEGIAVSTLDCHNAALACQALESEDLLPDSQEHNETSSDYGSLSAGGESSASDSDDEIDVVTVRRPSAFTRSQQQQQLEDSRREQQRALKRCHLEIQQQHNYAAPRPASPPPPEQPVYIPQHKRPRGGSGGDAHRHQPGRSRSLASRQCVDTEDEEERRRTHNVMERQRRNELKNCFLRLRDNVPELSNNDKASKVIILKRAKESIHSLEAEERRLSSKKDRLKEKQEELRARLEQLKRR
ncbi:myelocytomatosis oncogene homolog [Chanos chanos]|uniref:Myelocytomatosis oncogene homolog n=1 Tax=Chanos chanos TaxID=29144 RepID=A0A6J2VWQ7_CHACN|nr:transcriptional regulator Myc-2-like [Chanos chanos]